MSDHNATRASDMPPPACSKDDLRIICDATVRLVELRQRGCAHLAVENVAPEIMHRLLSRLALFRGGNITADAFADGLIGTLSNTQEEGRLTRKEDHE